MFKLVVLTVMLAVAAASPNGIWSAGLAAPWGAAIASPLAAPIAATIGVAAPIGAYNYRGPLSLAPGQPASILAIDGRPLDTLSVNLDRAVHLNVKALEGGHLLKKRSIVSAPLPAVSWNSIGLAASPLVATAPLTAAPAVAWANSAHIGVPSASVIAPAPISVVAAPLGLGHGAGLGSLW